MTEVEHLPGPFLLCRVGSRICALPLAHVAETMRPLPVEPLTGMPPFVLGLAIIRGVPTPVVDAGRLLGAADTEHATRFVTLRARERYVALAVEAVHGVRALPTRALEENSPLLRAASADVVAAIGTLDSELLLVLRSARIVPDSVWTAIDTAGVRP